MEIHVGTRNGISVSQKRPINSKAYSLGISRCIMLHGNDGVDKLSVVVKPVDEQWVRR